MASEDLRLEVGGIDWFGWTSVSISRAVDAVAGSFELGLTDRWTSDMRSLPLVAGMKCIVRAGADTVITGYLDEVKPSFGAGQHAIAASGRDASADVVDCAAIHKPGEWKSITVDRLAAILAKPFGVPVRCEGSAGAPLPLFKLQPGESAWEALDRALRQRSLLAMPDGKGGIVLVKVGALRATTGLKQGENILQASATFDIKDRFSEYRVLGQQQGTNTVNGEAASAVAATAKDNGVTRYRPLVLTNETQGDAAQAKKRAQWEARVRAARSVTVDVTVQGWRQADGTLWPLNAMVRADIPYLRIEQDLLIAKVDYKLDSGGTTTRLTLRSPDAFLPDPKQKKDKDGDMLKGATALSQKEQESILTGKTFGGK